jgi:hypothetical protein
MAVPAHNPEVGGSRVYRNAFHWVNRNKVIKLSRAAPGSTWAAEILLFFQRENWNCGIPQANTVEVIPFYEPARPGTISAYRISDFKGLEADAVILLLLGKGYRQRQMEYVGISRARALLIILTEDGIPLSIPSSFHWD